ncbi:MULTISPECIES: TIGR04086 family membrane protein [Bacillales]|uniref:TIGR04086 family membrane protein n=1 Tax=Bacillales TaxID=1385 RepID=UPI000C002A2D|nr:MULTISPECIES: TIGR04086 family membrane protein [Bacillaceae]MCA0992579.1 TIGR04086 family membrane protein [Pseudalkalibacillus hwajinpoensis]PFG14072.1 putative membrane protein (TIGR04086 family) [Bacillus sp. es.036]
MRSKHAFSSMGSGLLAIIVIVLATSVLFSLILRFSSVSEKGISPLIIVATVIAFFIGGFISGGKGGERGWLLGGGTACMYIMLLFLIQYLGYRVNMNLEQLLYHAGYGLICILGGIIGVNVKGGKHREA